MAISSDSIITWADLTSVCYNAIINQCCNIDTYKSVPPKLQQDISIGQINPDNLRIKVRDWTGIGIGGSGSTWTASWYANSENLVPLVSSSDVNTEWNTFLTAAGIDTRSTKVIQAQDLTLAIGLYMQFMAYHLKPIYSRRQIFNTIESQTLFTGTKYLTDTILGTAVTPKYTLTGIDPAAVPTVTDEDIQTIVKNNMGDGRFWGNSSNPDPKDYILFNSYDKPVFSQHYLD